MANRVYQTMILVLLEPSTVARPVTGWACGRFPATSNRDRNHEPTVPILFHPNHGPSDIRCNVVEQIDIYIYMCIYLYVYIIIQYKGENMWDEIKRSLSSARGFWMGGGLPGGGAQKMSGCGSD